MTEQTIRRVTGERVATVTDLTAWRDATRLEDEDGPYEGLACDACGCVWWAAAVMLELNGLISAYTAMSCRDCGLPIGGGN